MSGEKRTYVSVEDRELRRLREQESRLRNVQQDLPERLNAVRRQAQAEMQQRLRPLEDRQRRQEGMIQNLSSDLADLERDTQRRLQAQHNDFMGRLRDQRGEYLTMFRDQDHKFTGMIESERRARQQSVDRLQGQINAIVADANRKQSAAGSFVADLSSLVRESDSLPHERFAPGRMDNLRRHVADANSSLNAGMPEAALSTAQRAYWELADLRALVMTREQEFNLIHQAALEEARTLLEEARANRRHELELGQGPERDAIALEVDHWTHGALSDHEQEVEGLLARLTKHRDSLTTDQVREIIAQLETLQPKTDEIVEQARQNILASQLRYNVAELAAEAFQGQGFSVQDAAYEGEDERAAYVVKLANIAGDEVVTVISPMAGEMGKNEVSIHSFEATFVDEGVRYQRAQEMAGFLRNQGLEVADPAHVGDAKAEYKDMRAVRHRTVSRTGEIRTGRGA
ncbi:MAG: hypothetical protein ACOC23_09310 [Thermodesulfobacteriota bacterium]